MLVTVWAHFCKIDGRGMGVLLQVLPLSALSIKSCPCSKFPFTFCNLQAPAQPAQMEQTRTLKVLCSLNYTQKSVNLI